MKSWCFLSDIHLSANWGFPEHKPVTAEGSARGPNHQEHPFEWLHPAQKASLIAFLDQIDPARTQGVVFLGDILDDWIYPVDVQPPVMSEIVAANPDFFAAVARLRRRGIAVVFVRGNHDMALSVEDLAAADLGELHFCASEAIRIGPLRAEHGHALCLFNARDLNTRFKPLPLGYFISRAVASATGHHNVRSQTMGEILQGLLDHVFLGEEFESVVLDLVLGHARLKSDATEYVMPNGARTTVATVKKAYEQVYENWPRGAMEALLAEKYGLGKVVAKRFSDQIRLVVCGHTHAPCLEGGGGQAYVNSGCWIRGDLRGDFVEVTPGPDQRSLHVELKAWDGRAQSTTTKRSTVLGDCPIDQDSWSQVVDLVEQ